MTLHPRSNQEVVTLNVDIWISSSITGKIILLKDPADTDAFKDRTLMFTKYPAGTEIVGWDTDRVFEFDKMY